MFANIQIKLAMICNFGGGAHFNSRSSDQNAASINTKKSMLCTKEKMQFQNVCDYYQLFRAFK